MIAEQVSIGGVSGLLQVPRRASACFVMAHGAGAGMAHPFMQAVAGGLAERGVATLRFQFPYMQAGSKRPDRPAVAHATIREAVSEAARLAPGLPLFAGGKSFGARMTSQAQAEAPLDRVRGLIFLGFPLHPAKKPAVERAAHLSDAAIPMLFLQGTRDALAAVPLLLPVTEALGGLATVELIEHADHAFHVPARSGRTDQDVIESLCATISQWITATANAPPPE